MLYKNRTPAKNKNVVKPNSYMEILLYLSILKDKSLITDKRCTKCLDEREHSYQNYIDKFKKKYSNDFNKLTALEKTVTNYYEHHIQPKNMTPKEDSDYSWKIYQDHKKIQEIRILLLKKLVENHEFYKVLNEYLQCCKQKCKKYYIEYIQNLENLIQHILSRKVSYKQSNIKLSKTIEIKTFDNNIILLAKNIGINIDALNKKTLKRLSSIKKKKNIANTTKKYFH